MQILINFAIVLGFVTVIAGFFIARRVLENGVLENGVLENGVLENGVLENQGTPTD